MPNFLLRTFPSEDAPVEFSLLELEKPAIQQLFDRAKLLTEMQKDHPDLLELSFRNFHCRFFNEGMLEKRTVKEDGQEAWDELYENIWNDEVIQTETNFAEGWDDLFAECYSYLFISFDQGSKQPYIYFAAQLEDFSADVTTIAVYLRDLEKFL